MMNAPQEPAWRTDTMTVGHANAATRRRDDATKDLAPC